MLVSFICKKYLAIGIFWERLIADICVVNPRQPKRGSRVGIKLKEIMRKNKLKMLFLLASIIILSCAQGQTAKSGKVDPQTVISKGDHAISPEPTHTTGKCESRSAISDQAKLAGVSNLEAASSDENKNSKKPGSQKQILTVPQKNQ